MKKILEDERTLLTPELIGTDEEKIQALGIWSSAVLVLINIKGDLMSIPNKLNLINALKSEIENIESEINNVSASINKDSEKIPSMTQDVNKINEPIESTIEDPVIDLTNEESKYKYSLSIEKIKKNAGI